MDNVENTTPETPAIDESPEETPVTDESTYRPLKECDDKQSLRRHELAKFQEKVCWYACYVQPFHELQVHDYLMGLEDQRAKTKRGRPKKEDLVLKVDPEKVKMECYVPLQHIRVKYSDRMVWKDKILIPGLIFVRCSIKNREPLFCGKMKEYVSGFMSDRIKHRPQPIPDDQMETFRALADSEYAFQMEAPTFKVGQSVLILSGSLAGHVAKLVSTKDTVSKTEYQTDRLGNKVLDAEGNPIPKHEIELFVCLTDMLCAKFYVNADNVRVVPDGTKTKLPID